MDFAPLLLPSSTCGTDIVTEEPLHFGYSVQVPYRFPEIGMEQLREQSSFPRWLRMTEYQICQVKRKDRLKEATGHENRWNSRLI